MVDVHCIVGYNTLASICVCYSLDIPSRAAWGRAFLLIVRYSSHHQQPAEDFELSCHTNESIAAVRRHILQRYVCTYIYMCGFVYMYCPYIYVLYIYV